jgi:predicted ATPase
VVLRGEVGIGKTRLARKFVHWASAQGAELLLGSAFESGSHLPFQPLLEAFRLRLAGENSLTDLVDDIWLSPLSQLLPELRQHYPSLSPSPVEPTHLEAEVSQVQLYEPLVQCMLALAKRAPLVMFMDDLQWADSATLDLLQYAIRRWQDNAARILFLASLRSEALRPVTQPQPAGSTQGLSQWLERVARELTPVHLELEQLGERMGSPST